MIEIDQHTAVDSLNKALVPGDRLIDGRSEEDMLDFLSGFAGVINFYDNNNKINGNWVPFLLKDPAFIAASIAKTRYATLYDLYHKTCLHIEQLLKKNAVERSALPSSLNTLFYQVTSLFFIMEHWTYYMQSNEEVYDLKSFVIDQVRLTHSAVFWAVQAMQEDLYLNKAIPGIDAVKYYLFDRFDSIIWRERMNKTPYWDVLEINKPIRDTNSEIVIADKQKENEATCYKALRYAGDKALNFIRTTIRFAPAEFEKLNATRGRYPDTILLRTFIHLLQVQQKQLNGIADRHLEFYYRDILKQKELPAKADHVFVCAQVSTPTDVFRVHEGTLFNAGDDAQKNPILFENADPVTLNPAVIVNSYTLAVKGTDTLSGLYLQSPGNTAVLTKDESGQLLGWETFGGSALTPAVQQKTALVLASPMLYLKEGRRTIVITLNFEQPVRTGVLTGATWYLSTQKNWLKLDSPAIVPSNGLSINPVITIQLDAAKDAIMPFLEKPVGLESLWPMLKIEFDTAEDLAQPPVITSFNISVTVTGIKNLVLNNDYGALSTKTPYPLFGPAPPVNSSFMIGSSEIFSKPVDAVYMSLEWGPLPPNGFQDYYQLYNNCIRDNFVPPPPPVTFPPFEPGPVIIPPNALAGTASPLALPKAMPPKKNIFKRIFGGIWKGIKSIGRFFKNMVMAVVHFFVSIFKFIWKAITNIIKAIVWTIKTIGNAIKDFVIWLLRLSKEIVDALEDDAEGPYNNVCFTVEFYLLQEQTWNWLPVSKEQSISVTAGNEISVVPYQTDGGCLPPVNDNLLLFSTTTNIFVKPPTLCMLTTSSYFAYGTAPTRHKPVVLPLQPVSPQAQPKKSDPFIQLAPLEFTDSIASGFMKMTLTAPVYGFGMEIYPMVVSDLALQNALIISRQKPDTKKIKPAPNVPFTPLLASFTADYTASHNYDLALTNQDYPLQCFLISPFSTYKVYDNTNDWEHNNEPVANAITGLSLSAKGVPLLPSFAFNGALFLELATLIPANVLNLYFELARNYSESKLQQPAQYFYLGKKGWTLLPLLSDGTNNFSCSGIIQLNIPSDIVNNSPLMPGNNYWISIAANGDLSSFSKTVYLNTNGFELKRSGNFYVAGNEVPELKSGAITKPQNPIPQVAAVEQPFPSFGGKAAENQITMNRRVSNRIKTKDRVVSSEDYYRLISQEFKDVYYSKVVFDAKELASKVYVIKAVAGPAEANAFVPLITRCREEEIRKFLKKRASAFANIQVHNFNPEYVSVTASITLSAGYEGDSVVARVQNGINLYLSPWIAGNRQKVSINQPISNSQVAEFIQSIEGVSSVSGIILTGSLNSSYDTANGTMPTLLYPSDDASLFVSSLNHTIHYLKGQ